MPDTNLPPSDPYSWEDPMFAPLDTRSGETFADKLVSYATPEEKAKIDEIEAQNGPLPVEADTTDVDRPINAAPIEEPASTPEVFKYADGSSITIERTAVGVKATLDPGNGGGAEIFHGKDDAEVLRQLAPAKLNATKKIREQGQQLKLRVQKTDTPRTEQPTAGVKRLSADEVFEIKTQLEADPDLALDNWFAKKTGLSLEQLVAMANDGREASLSLHIDTEARAFRDEFPQYVNTADNYRALLTYIAAQKLNKQVEDGSEPNLFLIDGIDAVSFLLQKNLFNREVLGEAFQELAADGLLQLREEAPPEPAMPVEPAPVTAASQPQPVAAKPGIPAQTQPTRATKIAASYGLRPGATSVAQPEPVADRVPSAEELDDLSNEEIEKLWEGVRRLRAQQQSTRR